MVNGRIQIMNKRPEIFSVTFSFIFSSVGIITSTSVS